MNLYQIENEISACVDAETGEIIDIEKLEALSMERDRKLTNVACWIKNLEADAAALKAEKEAFAERQRKAEAQIERLKGYLTDALRGEKFSSAECEVSFRKSEIVYIPLEGNIPKKYCKKIVEYKPDKIAIKAALKAGTRVRGAMLQSKLNAQIK